MDGNKILKRLTMGAGVASLLAGLDYAPPQRREKLRYTAPGTCPRCKGKLSRVRTPQGKQYECRKCNKR